MIVFALLPLILLTIAALNFLQIRTPKANSNLQDSVDVVVPMRNEAENVEGWLHPCQLKMVLFTFTY